MRAQGGFNLTEGLVSLLVVSTIFAVAAPAFRDLRLDLARSREIDAWLQSIHAARAEAIKRNAVVSICPSADGRVCTVGTAVDWAAGHLVFVNSSPEQPPVRDESAEPAVRVHPARPQGRIFANRDWLSFRPFGQSGVTATFVFCDPRGSPSARALIISQTGRPRISTTRSSGEPLTCA